MVEPLTPDHKFEGSVPAASGTKRENSLKYLDQQFSALLTLPLLITKNIKCVFSGILS